MKVNLIKTNRVLSATGITLADFVINPFRGCEFGCLYCYSRRNKNTVSRDHEWGSFVDVKVNSPEVLLGELEKRKEKNIKVMLGSVTEVAQPVEEQYGLTGKILMILRDHGIPCLLLTKSLLIERYLDLLTYSPENEIYFTCNSSVVKDLFEKKTPSGRERLDVMQNVIRHGIRLTAYISPYFPVLTDYRRIMEELSVLDRERFTICWESYNMRMGNWEAVKTELDPDTVELYNRIYGTKESSARFWSRLRQEILLHNEGTYDFRMRFLFRLFNDYYKNEIDR